MPNVKCISRIVCYICKSGISQIVHVLPVEETKLKNYSAIMKQNSKTVVPLITILHIGTTENPYAIVAMATIHDCA